MNELIVKRVNGIVHIRGVGPCNWAQGPTIQSAEPFAEAGPTFLRALKKLQSEQYRCRHDYSDGDVCNGCDQLKPAAKERR